MCVDFKSMKVFKILVKEIRKKKKKKLFGLLSFETKYEKSYTFLFLSWREEEWFLELSEIKK